ncbi:PCI domain-containing protein [Pochonia chlamydosporia 170]|uniref:PCI domain-containing protein n=1 Tax=Pochonia chlamydosporia 170 TaxID=1380566 RepID=A0A179G4S7_METCM|nr:PCI domain-containing protein [Pochonia chlamydosporia 170]OAQ72856.1 PCI domain-containing protein [Pochonia chlamydosporia 170]
MRFSAALVALAAASAQAQTKYNYTSELDMTIDPNTVPQTERATWCQGQTNTCRLLCNADAAVNSCSESTLKWNCTCSSNSSTPGIQYYKQTMPFYICQALFSQCITTNAGNAQGQDVCNNNIKPLCAKNDPPKSPIGDSSGGSSSTTDASKPTQTGGSNTQVTTTSSKGLAGPTMAPVGNGVFVAAMGLMAYML